MILDLAVYATAVFLMCAIPCWLEARRDRAAAKAKHPANLPPGVGWAPTFDDATEAAIEQAVGVVDDGKALVRETEAFLEGRQA